MLTIMFTRAAASSADTLMISAVLDEDNDEAIYQPAARVFQYEHKNQPGEQWFVSDFSLSVQDIAVIEVVRIHVRELQEAWKTALSAQRG